MKRHRFGSGGVDVSVIGQGTWMLEKADRRAALATLRRGLDLGLSHIDTAEMYGSGAAETIVGEAIDGRRDEGFLVTKVLPSNASRSRTVQACDQSLKRLGTDRLDCLLLHWRGSVPLAETFAAFADLQQAGKILSWGVSNFDVDDLEEAAALVGRGKIACNQVLYHLGERAVEHRVLPWCVEHDVALVAYSPFGQEHGFPQPGSPGGAVLASIAERHGATARQVALAFLTSNEGAFAIPKASSEAHVADNAGAGDIQLTEDDRRKLDAAFPRGALPRRLPMI